MILALTVKMGVGPIKVSVAFSSRHPCLTLWPLIFFCQVPRESEDVSHISTTDSLTYTHGHSTFLSLSFTRTHTFSFFLQIPRSISALEFCDQYSVEQTKNGCLDYGVQAPTCILLNPFPFRTWLEPASHGTLEPSVVL